MLEQLGRYQVQSELGRGAMGVVYRARDPLIDRTVAIKTIRVDLPADELALFEARFFTEVRAAGSLNHANIVTIHDAGKEGGLVYVAMELLDGPSLAELLASHTPVPPARIASIGAQIADALAYAHGRGIVHRDVKPANIIVVRDRLPKLTDFGVARLPNAATTLGGTLIGSPKYMSPEQVSAQQVDGRSDVFSLGVVLYELLTGEAPFTGDNLHAVMRRVVHHEPPAPAQLNPRVPTALDAIVRRAMAKNPDHRYPSAREFAKDLKRFARGELVTFKNAPLPPHPVRAAPTVGDETIELRSVSKTPLGNANAEPAASVGDETVLAPAPVRYLPFRRAAMLAAVPLLGFVAALVFSGPSKTPTALTVTGPSAPDVIATHVVAGDTSASVPAAPIVASTSIAAPELQPESPPKSLPEAPTEPARPPADAAVATPTFKAPSPPARAAPARPTSAPTLAKVAPVVPAPKAKLIFAIAPWGEIYVDGERVGVAPPLRELSVPAGRRKVEIRNADLAPHIVMLDLDEHSAVRIKYQFR
jgi:eukaryotic-like serine/threonine-protein kinase